MADILENIIYLRKELTEVSVQSYGFMGYVDSVSAKLKNCLISIQGIALRECYYADTNYNVELDNIKPDKRVCIKIGLDSKFNFYNTCSEFINANKIKLKDTTFYIHEIDYLENKSQKNDFIENYKINIELIKLLQKVSDYNKSFAGDLELFFYKAEQGALFKVDYNWQQIPDDLSKISAQIKDIDSQFMQSADAQERKQIFKNELVSLLNKEGNSYPVLLNNIKILIENYQKSFDLYLAGFSFEKIKTASIEYFHELTDRIHNSILKYSTYIFAIPLAYIFLIRFLDFSGKSLLKDSFLILLGIVFFTLIWFVLFQSVRDAILSVERDINSFKSKLGNDEKLDPIKKELDNQLDNIIPKQKNRLLLVKILIALTLLLSIGAYTAIHYEYFMNAANKTKTEKLDKANYNKNSKNQKIIPIPAQVHRS